jgi:hypothetical protein
MVAEGATASENPSLYFKSKSEREERKKEERVREMEVEGRWVGGGGEICMDCRGRYQYQICHFFF